MLADVVLTLQVRPAMEEGFDKDAKRRATRKERHKYEEGVRL